MTPPIPEKRLALPMGWHRCRLDSGEQVEVWAGLSGVPERIEWPEGSGHLRQIVEVVKHRSRRR